MAFDDPYALTLRDESSHDEERWITLGAVGPEAVLLVVHTRFDADGEGVTRIISARTPESHERRAYEEAKQGADIAAIAAMRDEDIDFSDIPLVLDWSKAEMGKFYRPPKKSVTIRLDADVLK